MKLIKLILPAVLLALIFTTCDSSKTNPVINSEAGAPAIMSPQPGESFTLTEEAVEDTLLIIEWTEPDFGFEAAPTYTVRMDMPADDSDPVNLGSTNSTSFPIMTGDFNSRLLSAGAVGGSQTDVVFTVVSELGDSMEEVSEPLTVQFIPFAFEVEVAQIFVPGSFQAAGFYGTDWTPETAPPLASENNDDLYEGFVYFDSPGTAFKFTLERNWDVNWGDTGADGTLNEGGDDIIEPEAGFYMINVDLNDLTYSTTLTDWGVIGDATPDGWDADQDMTYIAEDKVWRITLDMVAGEMKFRANDDWVIDFGDDDQDGFLDFGGANIPVPEAGNYTVEMDLSNPPEYTFTLQLN